MIERKYKCDLCGDEYPREERDMLLLGIYWIDFPERGWEVREALNCEHHICRTCIISIQKINL